jgi:hypothetical protein
MFCGYEINFSGNLHFVVTELVVCYYNSQVIFLELFGRRKSTLYLGTYGILNVAGTHADLLITVFHKIITTGHQRLQPLFDCLLTILVNGTYQR